jgi:hypothetical protein
MLKGSGDSPFTDKTQPTAFQQEPPRVRTRGPIRNLDSGSLAAAAVLSELIKAVRRQVGSLPLTIMVHGQDASSENFLERLSTSLQPGDTLWLVAGRRPIHTAELQTLEGMVSLNLRQEQDARLYHNLFSDLAFFSASDEEQVYLAARLRNQSRVIIIYRLGTFSDPLFAAVAGSGDPPSSSPVQEPCITTIRFWDGAEKLETAGTTDREIGESLPQALDPDAIGKELKERAVLWEREQDRRIHFQALIESLRGSYPSSHSIFEDLIRQADANEWPAWAVQSIGPLYVPLTPTSDRRAKALIWYHLLNCIADRSQVQIVKELCNGQIQEALLAPAASELLTEIDEIFQESISTKGVPSDRAFLGLFAHVLQEVELSPGTGPETTRRIKEVRESILQESGVMRDSETA